MKKSDHPPLYFSAYPLKATNQQPSADQQSPFLKAILTGKTRTLTRVRVSPMVNPYRGAPKPAPVKNEKLPKDIELSEKDWFKNYE
jgi:hypothetical protein